MNTMSGKAACRICGRGHLTALFEVRGHHLEQCHYCEFVQVREHPEPEELEAIYQETYFGHNKYRDEQTLRIENLRRLALLQEYVQEGSQVLEAGCGDGSFIEEAKAMYDMSGFDLSAAGIEIAKARNPELTERLWVGQLEDQEIQENCFDAICMWDVIEHVWNPLEVSQNLLQFLKPNGILLISTPNIGAPIAQIMRKRWAFMTPPEHLSFLNKASMSELFEQQLNTEILRWQSLGKRANVGFIFYKARRVLPLLPAFIPRLFEKAPLSKLSLYVPTGDIQYVAIRKG